MAELALMPRFSSRASIAPQAPLAALPSLVALACIFIYFGCTEPFFLTPRNLYNLLVQSAVVATLAVGMTFVLLLGEIDLSAAALAGLGAAVLGVLAERYGWNAAPACAAALACGALFGLAQGFVVACVGVPSFIVTLATLLSLQGAMLWLLGSTGNIPIGDASLLAVMDTNLSAPAASAAAVFAMLFIGWRHEAERRRRLAAGLQAQSAASLAARTGALLALLVMGAQVLGAYRGVPVIVVLLLALAALLASMTRHTAFGLHVRAIGGDADASARSGIGVRRTRIAVFALAGAVAAAGGVLGAARYQSVSYSAFAGGTLLLDVIGAAVIGGTSLFGGRGSVWCALLGALVIGALGSGLDLSGATSAAKLMLSGGLLLVAVSLDAFVRGRTNA